MPEDDSVSTLLTSTEKQLRPYVKLFKFELKAPKQYNTLLTLTGWKNQGQSWRSSKDF